jgi:translation initiation factor IF-2
VGKRADDVRLVRVFGVEEELRGATKVGAYQYLVDRYPASMKQVGSRPEERGRRGGGGRGGGGGGRPGGKGAGAGTTGGFSMDSLREDRKNERGGGRGRPGGGPRRPGGGAGGPGGAPKK